MEGRARRDIRREQGRVASLSDARRAQTVTKAIWFSASLRRDSRVTRRHTSGSFVLDGYTPSCVVTCPQSARIHHNSHSTSRTRKPVQLEK